MASPRVATAQRLGRLLRRERLALGFGALTLLLAVADPRPWARWRDWLELPTLLGLLALLASIEGVRASGAVQRAAQRLARRARSQRGLAVMLVLGSALLAMALTNDVSLFLLVPLTLELGRGGDLPVRRLVILEALGVNAGSTLSPVGNPQNLLLWRESGLSMLQFAERMLPAFAVMLALLLLTVRLVVPARAVHPDGGAPPPPLRGALAAVSALLLLAVLALLQAGLAAWAALLVLAVFALGWREVLRRLDWGLLATLAAMFVGLGHLAVWPPVQRWIGAWAWREPLPGYLGAIVLSQGLSNVPATVLLHGLVASPMRLAVAVNVGGFGLAMGSLANLIALRLHGERGALAEFHRISVPFLLACAPAVWAVQRLLAG